MFNFFKRKPAEFFLTTDIHSHLLPDLDDGVKSWEESIIILKALEELGIQQVVTTPHIMSDYYPNTPEIIRSKVAELNTKVQEAGLNVKVQGAAEYYMDEDFLDNIGTRDLITFGDDFILTEMPFLNKPLIMEETFFKLSSKGLKPVLAHPERYLFFQADYGLVEEVLSTGVLFQINVSSLSGYYSPGAKKLAEYLISKKKVHFLGSDIHNEKHLKIYQKTIQTRLFQKCRQLDLYNHTLSL